MVVMIQNCLCCCVSGWLPEPESRPSFDDLHQRLKDMLKDPSRYVLTVVSLFNNCVAIKQLIYHSTA